MLSAPGGVGSQIPIFSCFFRERAISRILSWATICLGEGLPLPSSCLPGVTAGPATPFGIAPGGVYRAPGVATGAVGSYPTFSPLPRPLKGRGGLFSVALSLGLRPVPVRDHPALWSSDFPPALRRAVTRPLPINIIPCGGRVLTFPSWF